MVMAAASAYAFFQRYGALKTDHVMGQRNVIVRGRKRLFEQSEGSGIPAAESYLGLVVEYQFIRGAGAADRADLSVDAPFFSSDRQ